MSLLLREHIGIVIRLQSYDYSVVLAGFLMFYRPVFDKVTKHQISTSQHQSARGGERKKKLIKHCYF